MAGENETLKLGLKKPKLSKDRISQLPDCILLHILSFLTTKEVMQTSVLSERWKLLWTGISEINLEEGTVDIRKLRRFVDLVGRMLIMCGGIHLNKFSVRFPVAKFTTTLNLWAQLLVKYKVKYVTLKDQEIQGKYRLPQVLYSHSSMMSLTTSLSRMNPRGAIKWVSLKRLSLKGVVLSDSLMKKILLGSPILEDLQLSGCRGLYNLNLISSPTLATLIIEHREDSDGSILEISAPHVLDLSIIDSCEGDYIINNVSSVVRAKIYYNKDIVRPGPNFVKELLESLHSVKDLVLGPDCIWALSELELEGWQFPTSALESLTLNPYTGNGSIPGILNILKSSPMLETLAITTDHILDDLDYLDECSLDESSDDGRDDGREDTELDVKAAAYLQNGNMDLVLSHLKTIKIITFSESIDSKSFESMLKLIQILFTGATHLEKMIISPIVMDINKLEAKLISFPRASPKSVVVFEK